VGLSAARFDRRAAPPYDRAFGADHESTKDTKDTKKCLKCFRDFRDFRDLRATRLRPSTADAATRPLPRRNLIDEFIFGKIEQDGVPHAPLSSDEEFVDISRASCHDGARHLEKIGNQEIAPLFV
jgi:hypothetical protein